jgi:hypothetical protein
MKPLDRREAIEWLGRSAVLGGLGLLAGLLGSRATASTPHETACSGAGRCGNCPAMPDCQLPRGLSARQVLRNEVTP